MTMSLVSNASITTLVSKYKNDEFNTPNSFIKCKAFLNKILKVAHEDVNYRNIDDIVAQNNIENSAELLTRAYNNIKEKAEGGDELNKWCFGKIIGKGNQVAIYIPIVAISRTYDPHNRVTPFISSYRDSHEKELSIFYQSYLLLQTTYHVFSPYDHVTTTIGPSIIETIKQYYVNVLDKDWKKRNKKDAIDWKERTITDLFYVTRAVMYLLTTYDVMKQEQHIKYVCENLSGVKDTCDTSTLTKHQALASKCISPISMVKRLLVAYKTGSGKSNIIRDILSRYITNHNDVKILVIVPTISEKNEFINKVLNEEPLLFDQSIDPSKSVEVIRRGQTALEVKDDQKLIKMSNSGSLLVATLNEMSTYIKQGSMDNTVSGAMFKRSVNGVTELNLDGVLCIVDEAHVLLLEDKWAEIVEYMHERIEEMHSCVLFTATPFTTDTEISKYADFFDMDQSGNIVTLFFKNCCLWYDGLSTELFAKENPKKYVKCETLPGIPEGPYYVFTDNLRTTTIQISEVWQSTQIPEFVNNDKSIFDNCIRDIRCFEAFFPCLYAIYKNVIKCLADATQRIAIITDPADGMYLLLYYLLQEFPHVSYVVRGLHDKFLPSAVFDHYATKLFNGEKSKLQYGRELAGKSKTKRLFEYSDVDILDAFNTTNDIQIIFVIATEAVGIDLYNVRNLFIDIPQLTPTLSSSTVSQIIQSSGRTNRMCKFEKNTFEELNISYYSQRKGHLQQIKDYYATIQRYCTLANKCKSDVLSSCRS
jgi:hypothetical protein